ncbi:hypothetical protein AJ79_08403 [Helicocarpus griseus UAMH5409]|uniref:Cytochrome P450 n=1 Tax=Helicocarpus griseus UAMH5409 TaxID=1447875 RepID=A0A2B7WTP8_9EURO|nr:hypothetical protein AJ79_08403 [Helicocarpus griseus UAMH5409]
MFHNPISEYGRRLLDGAFNTESCLASELFIATCAFCFVYVAGGLIYRLYISPLSKFPGPKLAAATLWYEFYYDAVLKGQYTFKIQELHKRYGPIVRVSPNELHIDDPDFYHVLYSYSPGRDKYPYYLKPFDFPLSAFGTESHQAHRLRRGALNPFFSKRRVAQHEALVRRLVHKLCERLQHFHKAGKTVPLSLGYTCFATDLITSYVLNEDYQYLDAPGWLPHWGRALKALSEMVMVSRQITWVFQIFKCFPSSWAITLNPGLGLFFKLAERHQQKIDKIVTDRNRVSGNAEKQLSQGYTLVDQVLDSRLSSEEKTRDRLLQEVRSTTAAGVETTSNALSVITYHVLANPEKHRRLRDELLGLAGDRETEPNAQELDKLPYLTSVILEGLRLSYGVSTRLQRKSPNQTLQYKTYAIPPGTPVGMTSVFMHHNETIFPNSYEFVPERWLDLEERKRLERYLVSFGKGSRRCVGQSLAQTTLLVSIATIFRKFVLELQDTSKVDIEIGRDLFVPRPKNRESIGLQVIVKSEVNPGKEYQ